MKQKVHTGHLGINACLRRARDLIYWPGISSEIRAYIETCATCATYGVKQAAESPIISEQPERAWSKVATYLFSFGGKDFLVTVDCYSSFVEVDFSRECDSSAVIVKLKSHFARYGIPDLLISDNGPHFKSSQFRQFAEEWGFQHRTSSPRYPQGNGSAEAAVKVAKSIMRKCSATKEDYFLALLNYRNTPTTGCESSPAQRLMGKRTKTTLPIKGNLLKHTQQDHCTDLLSKEMRKLKSSEKSHKDLVPLRPGDNVRIQPHTMGDRQWKEATVKEPLPNRSYIVETNDGKELRRNRRHLRKCQQSTHSAPVQTSSRPKRAGIDTTTTTTQQTSENTLPPNDGVLEPTGGESTDHHEQDKDAGQNPSAVTEQATSPQDVVRTRSGRISRKPDRYTDCSH